MTEVWEKTHFSARTKKWVDKRVEKLHHDVVEKAETIATQSTPEGFDRIDLTPPEINKIATEVKHLLFLITYKIY